MKMNEEREQDDVEAELIGTEKGPPSYFSFLLLVMSSNFRRHYHHSYLVKNLGRTSYTNPT